MESKNHSGLLLAPVIYAILIFLFLFLHFSQFDHFSREMNNASYSGTLTKGRGITPSRVSKLNFISNGLKFHFSFFAPLTMITQDGIERKLQVQSISRDGNALRIQFKYDTAVLLTSDPLSNNSKIEFSVPRTLPPVTELKLQASPQPPFILNSDKENRRTLSDGTSTYFLNMDQEFSLNPEKGILQIFMDDRTSTTLALEDEAPGLGRSVREWLGEKEQIGDKTFQDASKTYITLAYEGLKSRYDKNLGKWLLPDGKLEFKEQTLVSLISESLRRSETSLILPDLLNGAERNGTSLTWYSSLFTGDIVNKGAPLLRGNPSALMKNFNLFTVNGNPDTSPYKEIIELETMLNGEDQQDYEAWIEENLYPLIFWLEEGLFLFHPENPVCDSRLNLKAADLLMKAGDAAESEALLEIGRKIMISLLEKADNNGFLPEKIYYSRDDSSRQNGYIRPETVLTLFPKEEYSPRISGIAEYTGQGDSWLYTVARTFTLKKTETALDIDLFYPKGQIHHIILKGIIPFDRIILHGIMWKSDPRFQRYSDGWVYDPVNQTLYVKIKQRANRETISIRTDPVIPEPQPETLLPPPADSESTPVETADATAPAVNG